MMEILAVLGLGLNIVAAIVLVRKYIRTRDVGLVWLGVAVLVWPLLSRLLDEGEGILLTRVNRHQPVIYPFSLVEQGSITMGQLVEAFSIGQQLIGIVLLLIAVLYLYRTSPRLPVLN